MSPTGGISKEDLRRFADEFIARFDKRFDDERDAHGRQRAEDIARGDKQHESNTAWMARIHDEVRRTNGRVTTLEAEMRDVFRRIKERVRGVTIKDLTIWISIIGGTVAALTFLGWHK